MDVKAFSLQMAQAKPKIWPWLAYLLLSRSTVVPVLLLLLLYYSQA